MTTPTIIRSTTFTLFGVELRCHVLSDGQRVVDANRCEDFLGMVTAALLAGTPNDLAEVRRFERWQRGDS